MTIAQILPTTLSSGWIYKKIKYIGTIRYGVGEPPAQKEDGVLFVRATDIHAGKVYGAGILRVDPEQVPWHRNVSLAPNDIIVVRSGAYTGDSAIIPSEYSGAVVGFDLVLRCHSAHPSFVQYALLSEYLLEAQIKLRKLRAAQPHINAEDLGECVIILPSSSVQKAVAMFLETEASRIDALISKKERQIELLQEKRQAIIARAVTKGLDPSAKMKYSGMQWIGEIPDKWCIIKIKFVAKLVSGHTPSRQHPEYWEDCSIPWFGLVDVWQIRDGKNKYISETTEKISELGLANSSARLHPAGTVILSRTASVGFTGIMKVPMATTQDFADWICSSRIYNEYLYYVFRAMTSEYERHFMGSTHKTIYMPDIAEFHTPLPPYSEQIEIVRSIDQETEAIDLLEARIQNSIDFLFEYRSSLITAAVSGRIDFSKNKLKAPK